MVLFLMSRELDERQAAPRADEKPATSAAAAPAAVSAPRRFDELDSLRGLAAFSVVLHHFKLLWETGQIPRSAQAWVMEPLKLISSGREAVILFFLLSGFVLSLPAIKGRAQSYGVFIVRRVFRIYLPYLIALALAVLGAAAWHKPVAVSAWFNQTWSRPVEARLVFDHLLFVGNYEWGQFNTAFWSLVLEMRVSLVFPLLCWLALRLKSTVSVVAAFAVSALCCLLPQRLAGLPVLNHLVHYQFVFLTLHYACVFVVGIALARERERLARIYQSTPMWAKAAGAAVCIVLYAYGRTLAGKEESLGGTMAEWLPAIGGAGIILLALNSGRVRSFLLLRPVHFLGRISYSMYLVHATILFALVHALYGRLTLWQILPLYLALVFLVSPLMYYAVERPAMNLGRALTGRARARVAAPDASVA